MAVFVMNIAILVIPESELQGNGAKNGTDNNKADGSHQRVNTDHP